MKNFIIFFSIIFFLKNNLLGFELDCHFEEVYSDGSIQQGLLLFKENKLRYQYYDPNLYTLIYNENLYLIPNDDKKSFRKLNNESSLFEKLTKIFSDYPNIDKAYYTDEFSIKLELSSNNFIKRIGIESNSINLSINILNCQKNQLFERYFKYFPLEDLNK